MMGDKRMKQKLGIIGGLGPMASAQFMAQVTSMTDAKTDQQHIETVLYSRPATPDRTAFLTGQSDDTPLPMLLESAKALESFGCGVLVMPCMTAYSFYEPLCAELYAELINPITESAQLLKARGIRKAGIMATDGTMKVGLFQQALMEADITPIVPDAANQREVMHMIYEEVKSGKPADLERFHAVTHSMRVQGAECIILGCTELSVIKQQQEIGGGFLDAMEVLSARAIEACGYKTRSDIILL